MDGLAACSSQNPTLGASVLAATSWHLCLTNRPAPKVLYETPRRRMVAPAPSTVERAETVSPNIYRMTENDIDRPNSGPEPTGGELEGDPIERTHEYYSSDGRTSGVWECSEGRWLEEQGVDEFCTIISGKVGVIDNNNDHEEIFSAGDSFFLPKSSTLTWVVYETVRKFYMTAE